MKDINVVLRDKRVQLSELALEINGLEAAVTALRPVAHLLSDENPSQGGTAAHLTLAEDPSPAQVAEPRAVTPERSRVRRWV